MVNSSTSCMAMDIRFGVSRACSFTSYQFVCRSLPLRLSKGYQPLIRPCQSYQHRYITTSINCRSLLCSLEHFSIDHPLDEFTTYPLLDPSIDSVTYQERKRNDWNQRQKDDRRGGRGKFAPTNGRKSATTKRNKNNAATYPASTNPAFGRV